MLIEFFCIATSASVQWSFLCIHVFWTYAKTTHRLIMYYFTFSYFSSSINKKNMFALPHKKYARTGVCRFSFLSFFFCVCDELLNCTRENQFDFKAMKKYKLAPISKVQFFSLTKWHDFFFVYAVSHLQTKRTITFILFYLLIKCDGTAHFHWLKLVFFSRFWSPHLFRIGLCNPICFRLIQFDQLCVFFFKKEWKKPIWVTKKNLCTKLILWMDKLKVKSIMAASYRLHQIRIWSAL